MRRSHRPSLGSDSAGWSGTFLAARDALAQVATEANLAATQLHGLLAGGSGNGNAVVNSTAPGNGTNATGATNATNTTQGANANASASPTVSALRQGNPSLAESLPAEMGSTMRSWDRLGDRSAQVLAAGWASGIHAVSQELTNAIFVTGQWGEAFVHTGEKIVQQLIEVAAQALIVRTLIGAGLGGFFGLANGITSLPASGFARFASGGLNLDTIPALLSPGEAVLRASAVTDLGTSFLAGLNAGVVDLDRLAPDTPVRQTSATGRVRSGGPNIPAASTAPAQHFHFAFHDDGSAARRYLSTAEGRRFLVDTNRQTVHEVTGRS